MRSPRWLAVTTVVAGCMAAIVNARQAPQEALDGLDPVLLVQGREVAGKPELTLVRGRFEYSFSSEETRAAFRRAPERFEIQFNGACARMGPSAGGNPSDFVVHDGRIYVFGSDECHRRFVAAPAKYLPPLPVPMPDGATAKAQGRALVERAVAAVGGAARLDALVSYVESWSTTQTTAQGELPVVARALWRFPHGIRMERTITRADRTQTIARVIAAGQAWFDGGPGRIYPMSPDAVPELERTFGRHLIPLLRSRTSATFEASALEPATIAGLPVERVRVRRGPVDITLGVDASSGEVRALSFIARNTDGEFGKYEIALSDYRAVGSMRLPFNERGLFNGAPDPSLNRTLDTVSLDVPLDAALFARTDGPDR